MRPSPGRSATAPSPLHRRRGVASVLAQSPRAASVGAGLRHGGRPAQALRRAQSLRLPSLAGRSVRLRSSPRRPSRAGATSEKGADPRFYCTKCLFCAVTPPNRIKSTYTSRRRGARGRPSRLRAAAAALETVGRTDGRGCRSWPSPPLSSEVGAAPRRRAKFRARGSPRPYPRPDSARVANEEWARAPPERARGCARG